MDTTLLRAFVETADAGSLSRAARHLALSQPSLTGQIQRLEAHLGTPLFDRHGRGVTLTEAGGALYPRARRILDEVRNTEDAVRREGAEGAGTLSVGAIPTVAPYVLPAAVQRLRARHTATRVELREDYSAVLAKLLLDGVLDVVIAALPYGFEHLDTELLGTDALVVAVPASHAAARAGRITLSQLRDAPAVTLDPAHCLGELVAGFWSSRQLSPRVVCRRAGAGGGGRGHLHRAGDGGGAPQHPAVRVCAAGRVCVAARDRGGVAARGGAIGAGPRVCGMRAGSGASRVTGQMSVHRRRRLTAYSGRNSATTVHSVELFGGAVR